MEISQLPRIESREFMNGTVIALAESGETATVRFLPPAGMTNPHGGVQGGFVAAMIDDVVSLATWFAGNERTFATSSLACYYLRPVPMRTPLLASCRLLRVGRHQAVFDAFVTTEAANETLVKAVQTQQFL